MKKDNKPIILIFFIILFLVVVAFLIAHSKKLTDTPYQKNWDVSEMPVESINETFDTGDKTAGIEQSPLRKNSKTFRKINNWQGILDGMACIDSYNYAIENLYKQKNEESFADIIETDPSSQIINSLDRSYVQKNGLTKENVDRIATSRYIFVLTKAYYSIQTNYIFVAYGYLINKETNTTQDYGYLVQMNYTNQAFEIMPYEYMKEIGIQDIQEGSSVSIETEKIEKRISNLFSPNIENDQIISNFILNQFKNNALYKPEVAYKQLEKNYSSKFGSIIGFKQYVDQNADKLNAVTISKLEKESTNGEGIIYKCFNKSNDVFYIRSNSEECLDIQIDFSNIIF